MCHFTPQQFYYPSHSYLHFLDRYREHCAFYLCVPSKKTLLLGQLSRLHINCSVCILYTIHHKNNSEHSLTATCTASLLFNFNNNFLIRQKYQSFFNTVFMRKVVLWCVFFMGETSEKKIIIYFFESKPQQRT